MFRLSTVVLLGLLSAVPVMSLPHIIETPHEVIREVAPREPSHSEREVLRELAHSSTDGHFPGPDRPRSQNEIEFFRGLKNAAKNAQRSHQSEIAQERAAVKEAEMLAQYEGLTAGEIEKVKEIARLKSFIEAKQEKIRVETERLEQLNKVKEQSNISKLPTEEQVKSFSQKQMEELVDSAKFHSVFEMYTDKNGAVIPEKLQRLKKEIPDYEARMKQQATIVQRFDTIRAKLLPDAPLNDMIIAKTQEWFGSYGPEHSTALFSTDFDSNNRVYDSTGALGRDTPRNNAGVASGGAYVTFKGAVDKSNKNIWVERALKEVMQAQNTIENIRTTNIQKNIEAMKAEIKGTEGATAGVEQTLKDLQWKLKREKEIRSNTNDATKHRFGPSGEVDDAMGGDQMVEQEEDNFVPTYKFKEHRARKHHGVNVNVEVSL